MNKALFAHRPPSSGVHLLNDPFPNFIQRPAFVRTFKEKLPQKEHTAVQAKPKK